MAESIDLFPLRSVLFPQGLLGLKVFEARYLDLVTERWRSGRPFGVVCLRQGPEAGPGVVAFESVGVEARLSEVDAAQAGIVQARCRGERRFRIVGAPTQRADGLWSAQLQWMPPDASVLPPPELHASVAALARAITSLRSQGQLPFAEPFRLDDAGWVANRWCEILPIAPEARQKLMELEDPLARLGLVQEFLSGKGVI